jgi:hypothetical protein
VNKTGSDINSYRRPAAEMQPADLQVPRAPDIAPPSTAINRTEQDVFIETARDLINDLKSYVQFDINKPSDVKRVIGYIPDTLSQFVRKNGGIADAGGELANMGVTHKSLPGLVRNSNATSGVDMFGATRKNAQIDIVREKVFDAGFFPEKNNYNEISDSDLFQAIADDVNGKKRYSVDDLDRISVAREGSDLIRQYEAIGITSDMTEKEIADRLREIKADQEVQFDENAYSMREYRDTVIDPPVEIKPSDRFEASRASFKNLSDEEPDMLISFEDGSTLKLSEYAERMKEYDNILEAITTCRLA